MRFSIYVAGLMITSVMFFSSCQGQSTEGKKQETAVAGGIQWMSFEDAVAASDKAPKKLFIDVYTDWCGWCKKMDKSTFAEPEVAKFINENFYPVKLNAETRDTIYFRDKVFKYVAEYKANELAISLLSGKMGYPSYVLLDESYSMMTQPVQSYLTKDQIMPILNYYGGDVYKQKSWEEYEKETTVK